MQTLLHLFAHRRQRDAFFVRGLAHTKHLDGLVHHRAECARPVLPRDKQRERRHTRRRDMASDDVGRLGG